MTQDVLALNRTPAITEEEFSRFQALIHRETGIWLGPAKKALLVGRLSRRLRELHMASFGAYFDHVTKGRDAEEKVRMFDCVCTNETHFFREPLHWTHLLENVFPVWRAEAEAHARSKRIRVWSAACSTGEEPYTLAMLLLDEFPAAEGWSVEILGTDLSTRALAKAEDARWPLAKAAEIPEKHLKRWMLRGHGKAEGTMKAGPEIRSVVRFQRLNLNDASYDVGGPFDAIFCRNVLIYFDPPSKRRVIDSLLDRLRPDGLLFVGHSESLLSAAHAVRAVVPTVYVRTST